MKQYDYIYEPSETFGVEIKMADGYDTIREVKNVIVLTIEELREVWDKGYLRACEEYAAKYYEYDGELVAPSFTTYLTSKGVTIP